MKILVTGGAGYIGSIVSAMLVDAGHSVVAIDDLSTSDASGVPAGVEFIRCDISQVATVLTPDSGFDAVLHFAGLIAAGESVQKPGLYWHVNTGGSLSLLVAMRAAGVRKIVFLVLRRGLRQPDAGADPGIRDGRRADQPVR